MGSRTVGELLILMIGATVCLTVVGSLVAIAAVEILNPGADTSTATGVLSGVLNTLIGLMAGFLAGRTDTLRAHRDDG